MAMCAALQSTNMDSTAVEPAALLWRRILVDGKAANIAIQPTPTPTEGRVLDAARKRGFSRGDAYFQESME